MLINGEKWACESCVRGHRVSNCQHSDRPLQHINKKGRPVSQCQHCRTLRKSRSAHVRCDCSSDKTNKNVCTPEGGAPKANEKCYCHHGERCTCAFKKESLDSVLESDVEEPSATEKRRARTHTTSFDTHGLTIFTNGYHKLAHKHNNTAQKYGSPYPTPRCQSLRGPSPSGNHSSMAATNRSTYSSVMKHESVKKTPASSVPTTVISGDLSVEYLGTKENKESPVSSTSSSSIDLLSAGRNSSGDGGDGEGVQKLPSSLQSFLPTDINWPCKIETLSTVSDSKSSPIFLPSLSSASIEWSHYDGLTFNNESFPSSSFSQAPSYAGYDYAGLDQSTLTNTPTTGDLSEVDEMASRTNRKTGLANRLNKHHYSSDQDSSDFSGEVDTYHISSGSSYMHLPHTQATTNNSYFDDLDSFLKYSNTLSSHSNGLTIRGDENTGKVNQGSSPFSDSNLALFSKEDENEILWMSSISPSTTTVGGSTQNGLSDDFWAQ